MEDSCNSIPVAGSKWSELSCLYLILWLESWTALLSSSPGPSLHGRRAWYTPTAHAPSVIWKWGLPKMGTPGPHFHMKLGTPVPNFIMFWGPHFQMRWKWGPPYIFSLHMDSSAWLWCHSIILQILHIVCGIVNTVDKRSPKKSRPGHDPTAVFSKPLHWLRFS